MRVQTFKATELAKNAKATICENGPCQPCMAIAKVEIGQAVVTLRALLAKRCDLRSGQNRAHGLVRLDSQPNSKTTHSNFFYPRKMNGVESKGPWCCHVWPLSAEAGAWSDPFLWSVVHIVLGKSNSTSGPSNFLHDWILRSRTLPLTFKNQSPWPQRESLRTEKESPGPSTGSHEPMFQKIEIP